ncbi:sensor histidine kinase [Streptomyces sp. NPDC059853]|uniref:sensor histidine kinase n=1 Tax=Streptomyces sp. NPDC059853 TaxID=3346973 RepID=UPI00366748B3
MASVRAKAATGATVVVAVALVAAAVLMLVALRSQLTEQVDLRAEVTARDVAGQLATGTEFGDLDLDGSSGPVQVLDADDDRLLAVTSGLEAISGTESGAVRVADPSSADPGRPGDPPRDPDDDDDDDDDDEDARRLGPGEVDEDIDFVTGEATVAGASAAYRFAVVEVTTPAGVETVVFAGAPLDVEQAAVDSVRTSMLIGIPVLLAVVAAVTWLVTRRALRPVEGIRREMAAITHSADLSRRVPEPATHDEVGRLAITTNETLAALEASVERQRRFVADASHELRSPIASLRTQLEVGQAHPDLLDLPGAVHDTVRLQELAADLLLLARLDAGEQPVAGRRVDLTALVREELAAREPLVAGAGLTVRAELDGVTVAGSKGQLARVVGNLCDNALRHAVATVRVSLRSEDGQAVLEVADDGTGVPADQRERIFERFVRLDDARSRDAGGAGLGLAIARDVALRHHGALTVRDAPGGGALFRLVLPVGREEGDDT